MTLVVGNFGFSGSRKGMTTPQKQIIQVVMSDKAGILHHGDCVGCDAEIHDLCMALGNYRIVVHPPLKTEFRANKVGHEILQSKHYLERNRDIVAACQILIATPNDYSESGGTWFTIKHARKVKRALIVIGPDGRCFYD